MVLTYGSVNQVPTYVTVHLTKVLYKGLAVISTENEKVQKVDIANVIADFAFSKEK